MSRDIQSLTKEFNAEAEIHIIIDVQPPRQEECHGIHTFDDSEEVDRNLTSLKVWINDEMCIDITDRLLPEEVKEIIKESYK